MPKLTRRQFMKYVGGAAAALGISEATLLKLTEQLAKANPLGAPKVLWIAGGACSGCITSFANVTVTNGTTGVPGVFPWGATGVVDAVPATTSIEDVVVDILDLNFQETIQAPSGDLAIQETLDGGTGIYYGLKSFYPGGNNTLSGNPSATPYVVLVEGAVEDPEYCTVGRDRTAAYADMDIRSVIQNVSKEAAAVIAVGACSCFGGIPGARNQTLYEQNGTTPLSTFLSSLGGVWDPWNPLTLGPVGKKPLINVPGCPVQPEVLLLTAAGALLLLLTGNSQGLLTGLDLHYRPLPYYADVLHRGPTGGSTGDPLGYYSRNGCPHYDEYSNGIFATKPGDSGCLMTIGCKGLSTKTPCNIYGWNNEVPSLAGKKLYCTAAGHPCYGCMEKGYPDKFESFVKM